MVINITIEEVKSILDDSNTKIIDVRSPGEFSGGTIRGAINIDLFDPEFMNMINELDKNKHYLMLCLSGNRSGSAAGAMAQLGFSNVANIIGGMMSWDGEIAYPKAA